MKVKKMFKLLCAIMLCCFPLAGYSQLASVKTNALLWGNLTPNISFELVTSKRVSLEGSLFYTLSQTPTDCRFHGAEAEVRYWISGRAMTQLFIGLSVAGIRYEYTSDKDMHHQGDAAGPGIVLGYALPLSRHWNIEFAGGVGVYWFRERRYELSEYDSSLPYNESGRKFLPTKLTVSAAYTF